MIKYRKAIRRVESWKNDFGVYLKIERSCTQFNCRPTSLAHMLLP